MPPLTLTAVFGDRNKLASVPEWLCDSGGLEVLDISHNLVSELPVR